MSSAAVGLDLPLVRQLEMALVRSDRTAVEMIIDQALVGPGALTLVTVLDELVGPALAGLGQAWNDGTIALSQVYAGGRLCDRVIRDRCLPLGLVRTGQPRIAIGVLGDAHVLGKVLVLQVLQAAGYQVSDWGARLSPSQVVHRAVVEDVDVVMLSVLMLRSALAVADVRRQLQLAGREAILVVGGAPFRLDPALAAEVGADHVGKNASDVLRIMTGIEMAGGVPWR